MPKLAAVMRVTHVTCGAGMGGAGIAAVRLHRGLLKHAVRSEIFFTDQPHENIPGAKLLRFGNSFYERIWRRMRQFQLNRIRKLTIGCGGEVLQPDLSCFGVALWKALKEAEVIHFHSVINLLDYPYVMPRLREDVSLVWTLHDVNPATGGCLYPMECRGYEKACGNCPKIASAGSDDVSAKILERKRKAYARLRSPMNLVTPSAWLAGVVRRSKLLAPYPVQTIPNGLDTEIFRPYEGDLEKIRLGLSAKHPVVLFVASRLDDTRKGLRHLLEALPLVCRKFPAVQVVSVGNASMNISWPMHVKHLGAIRDEHQLARIYSAADCVVIPSEADNLPNVILEAMACGTPVVGFNIGGLSEAIKEGKTGLLAEQVNAVQLGEVVNLMLSNVLADGVRWRERCRNRALLEFSDHVQAARHKSLYSGLMKN